jgi:DNA-binding CsgD family transcriptional regulator
MCPVATPFGRDCATGRAVGGEAREGTVTVGRDAELGAVMRRLATAQSGTGGVLLITGEAGIGKTHLLAEAERLGRSQGMTVLLGRSVPGSGAYRPVAEALVAAAPPDLASSPRLAPYGSVLGRLLPGWPVAARPDRALVDPVVVLGEAVLELLGVIAGSGGVVVALDDLHWADPDSLALLGYLAGRIATVPVLLIGAARDEEPAGPGLAQLRDHRSVTVLGLDRLGSAEVGALARGRLGGLTEASVELVVRGSDGLPLLVEELVDALGVSRGDPGVPGTVAELTRRRMATLSGPDREVLQTAAVLGTDGEWLLLPVASGYTDQEVARGLRSAVDASLLVRDPTVAGSLRWRHALTRDAVLADLLPLERAAIARRAAAALDTGELSGQNLAVVAGLYAQCGHGPKAARLLLVLAQAAVDAGALHSAEDTLRRAADLAPADHDVVIELVGVLGLAGRIDEALTLGEAILSVVRGEPLTLLCLHLARAAVSVERWSDANRFLAAVDQMGDPRVDAVRATVALGEHDVQRAVLLGRSAASDGVRLGHPEAVCEALNTIGLALRRIDPEAAENAFAEAERCADDHGLTVWRIRALHGLGMHDLGRCGRLDRLQEARQRALDAGMLTMVVMLDMHIGSGVGLRDGCVAMLGFAEHAIAGADRLGLAPVGAVARFFAAIGRLFADDRERVEALLAEARALAPDSRDGAAHYADLDGMIAWLDGDAADAVAAFERNHAQRRRDTGELSSPVWGVWGLLRTVLDPTDAGPCEELRATDISGHGCNEGARLYAEAIAAARTGDGARADRLVGEADQVTAGFRYWRHLLRLTMVEIAAAEGFGDPQGWVRAALADLEGTGEVRVLRRCRELMRRLGLPVPRTAKGTGEVPVTLRRLGVTPRECEVLTLVELGLTNPQIAKRLHLSPRTVETHVASLLAKTGTPSRARLREHRIRTHD